MAPALQFTKTTNYCIPRGLQHIYNDSSASDDSHKTSASFMVCFFLRGKVEGEQDEKEENKGNKKNDEGEDKYNLRKIMAGGAMREGQKRAG